MLQVRKIVEQGLSARATAKIKVRQPLQSLTYHGVKLLPELEEIIADEVNIKKVNFEEGDANIIDLDLNITEDLKLEGLAREIIRGIQSLRKKSDFNVDDRIFVYWQSDSAILSEVMTDMSDLISKEVLAKEVSNQKIDNFEGEEEFSIEGDKIWFGLKR